jgi:hypothetical protein
MLNSDTLRALCELLTKEIDPIKREQLKQRLMLLLANPENEKCLVVN